MQNDTVFTLDENNIFLIAGIVDVIGVSGYAMVNLTGGFSTKMLFDLLLIAVGMTAGILLILHWYKKTKGTKKID